MHPYMKLEVDEDVPEMTLIRGLLRAGLDVTIDGDNGIIKVQVGQIIPSGQTGKVVCLNAYRAARK